MYYRKRTEFSVADVLEDRHAISILLFLAEHPDSKKTELYEHIPRNARTPSKISSLEDAGLLVQTPFRSSVLLDLTDAGKEVADLLMEIDRILKGEDVADRPSDLTADP